MDSIVTSVLSSVFVWVSMVSGKVMNAVSGVLATLWAVVRICCVKVAASATPFLGGVLGALAGGRQWLSECIVDALTTYAAFPLWLRIMVALSAAVLAVVAIAVHVIHTITWRRRLEELRSWLERMASKMDVHGPSEIVQGWLHNHDLGSTLIGYDIMEVLNADGRKTTGPRSILPDNLIVKRWEESHRNVAECKRLLRLDLQATYKMRVMLHFSPMDAIDFEQDGNGELIEAVHQVERESARVAQALGVGERTTILRRKMAGEHAPASQLEWVIEEDSWYAKLDSNAKSRVAGPERQEIIPDGFGGTRLVLVKPGFHIACKQKKLGEAISNESRFNDKYSALGQMRRDVSAGRKDVIGDADQRVYQSPLTAVLEFTVDGTKALLKKRRFAHRNADNKHQRYDMQVVGVEWVPWHGQICANTAGQFALDQMSLAGDFIRRKLNHLAYDETLLKRLREGCVSVVEACIRTTMARMTARSEHMAKRSKHEMERALKMYGLDEVSRTWFATPLDEEARTRSARRLKSRTADMVDHLTTPSRKALTLLFVGIALTPLLVESLAAKLPATPAKRAPVIKEGKRLKETPSVKYDLLGGLKNWLMPTWFDRNDPHVAEASFRGRVCKDNGLSSEEGSEALYAGGKLLMDMIRVPQFDVKLDHESMHAFVESRHWSRQKKDRHHKVIDDSIPEIVTRKWLESVSACEAFIKDETYVASAVPGRAGGKAKVKPPRNICNRSMEFKIVTGTLLAPLNDWFFEHEFCIKHIPAQQRGEYLSQYFAGKGKCLTTDHSAFESSANGVNQNLVEQLFYHAAVPRQYWDLISVISQPTWITNKATGARILTDTVRMSGDFVTSLGNSILNAASALAAYHKLTDSLPRLTQNEKNFVAEVRRSYGVASGRKLAPNTDPHVHELTLWEAGWREWYPHPIKRPATTTLTFMVEGDDAIVAAPDLPDAADYQAVMNSMGLNVTIEGAGDASQAGFCQVFWTEQNGKAVTFCDITTQLLNLRWSTHPPMRGMSKLDLFKSKLMSLLQLFPGCPVLWKLCDGCTVMAVENNDYEKGFLEAIGANYTENGAMVYAQVECPSEPTDAQRALFSELYGVSVDAQLELERDPVQGIELLMHFLLNTDVYDMYADLGDMLVAYRTTTDRGMSPITKM